MITSIGVSFIGLKLPGLGLLAQINLLPEDCVSSSRVWTQLSLIFRTLEDSMISLGAVDHPLHELSKLAKGILQLKHSCIQIDSVRGVLWPEAVKEPTRADAFACIAVLETGNQGVNSSHLAAAFAIALGDSIFVAAALLADPFEEIQDYVLGRIIGNIGHSGLSVLISPQTPLSRPLSHEYNAVEHAPYNCRRENNFKGTSLHLSFTEWTLPVMTEGLRTIDQKAQYVECVISVLDARKWVADLNVLALDTGTYPASRHAGFMFTMQRVLQRAIIQSTMRWELQYAHSWLMM